MKKKAISKQQELMRGVRKMWGFKPTSRVMPQKPFYSRKGNKVLDY